MKKFVFISLLFLPLLFIAGCFNNSDSTINTSTPTYDGIVDLSGEYDDTLDILSEDAYGKDLDLVERYPDSIRDYYSHNEYETDVSYQTSADQEDVRQFYTDKLLADGWELTEEATDYMEFMKGDDDNPGIFTLYLTTYQLQNMLQYELVYEPPYTDEQLAEFEAEKSDDDFEIEL